MGTCYQAMDKLDDALAAYQKASQLNPTEPSYKQYIEQIKQTKAGPLLEAAYQKQTTKREDGTYDLKGAIADYEQALAIWDDPNTRLNLGTAYQNDNNIQAALAQYKKAIAANAKLCDAYYYIGTVYEAMSKPALAIPQYKKCVSCDPAGANAEASKERIKVLGGR